MDGLFKSEFPPLLPDGLHSMTMVELRQLCVERFPSSTSRSAIMQGLEEAVQLLRDAAVVGELWINGSFLTEKIDPDDVDVTLRLDGACADTMTLQQERILAWFIGGEAKRTHRCHGFMWPDYPASDPRSQISDMLRQYWQAQWGASRTKEKKGIAVVTLPGSAT